jgi:hypothetical protein
MFDDGLGQGWPTFYAQGQNLVKKNFRGHFVPQKSVLDTSRLCSRIDKKQDLKQMAYLLRNNYRW